MNCIKDICVDRKNNAFVFFLQTDNEPEIWYWIVPLSEVGVVNYHQFVNDERNATLGYSVAGFVALQDAKADYAERKYKNEFGVEVA